MLNVPYIYLRIFVQFFGANAGKYIIHWAFGQKKQQDPRLNIFARIKYLIWSTDFCE